MMAMTFDADVVYDLVSMEKKNETEKINIELEIRMYFTGYFRLSLRALLPNLTK